MCGFGWLKKLERLSGRWGGRERARKMYIGGRAVRGRWPCKGRWRRENLQVYGRRIGDEPGDELDDERANLTLQVRLGDSKKRFEFMMDRSVGCRFLREDQLSAELLLICQLNT